MRTSLVRTRILSCFVLILLAGLAEWQARKVFAQSDVVNDSAVSSANQMIRQGRQIFRFDTFGDENFWGGALMLHRAIEGAKFGGVGPGLSPKMALALGLKVASDALPARLVSDIQHGAVNLDDPAVTLALLKLNAVVGVTGFFQNDLNLKSVGIQCSICHSVVDNSFSAPGIPPGAVGKRLDGWANRDLNIGAITNLAPDLTPIANVLGVDVATVQKVLLAWGPGKFDAELELDGKGFRPDGKTSAVLIPPAFGLAGVNLHTWTGWGSVTHWNAFVANIEMHGKGRFFDSRLDNPSQFPIAVKNGFADIKIAPEDDRITPKLAALHFYQLAIPAPKPETSSSDAEISRGEALFVGKARCNICHVKPLYTEPGWNMHKPEEVCVDDFQASRSPDRHYRTSPLGGLFTHQKGGFYHDGRFPTLPDVVDHYNSCFNLGLNNDEMHDLVGYLLSR